MNYTPLARLIFRRRGQRIDNWKGHIREIQLAQLRWLLFRGASTLFGRRHDFERILRSSDPAEEFAMSVPAADYEEYRDLVMRMTDGEKDILWPGYCHNFAQSSGTAGGRSKYIPITPDSLRINHYRGSADVVAQYLRNFPESRMFAGKGLILGGSFETRLRPKGRNMKVGDLSATLIDRIPPGANLFRVPDKQTALLADWHEKLDRLAKASLGSDITNLSGVPSWFLRVILRATELGNVATARELWPNLEVFFHGGISFAPYRHEYERLCGPEMRYFETYNASEGFFATQASRDNDGLLLLIDNGIYYEFCPIGKEPAETRLLGAHELEKGEVYEMIISSCNGLWRYRIGDTVKVVSTDPLKIRVAGRTKSFINAFGEELMESNAETAIAEACRLTGAHIRNYTAGPLYARDDRKGRHQWLIEWSLPPADGEEFARILDRQLCNVNSDYAAKRADNIFLDPPEIITLPPGRFDKWLSGYGSGKLGGQRKIPRLRNDRTILDALLD